MKAKLFQKKQGSVPHPWFALLLILLIVAVLVNFIPSGQYDRVVVDGRSVVDPTSYHVVDKVYSGVGNFFYSFYRGFCDASSLIAMVFFVGAGLGVVKRIGLLQTAIAAACLKMRKLPFGLVSFLVMLVIVSQVLFTGMWELNLVLLPVVIPLFMTLGYDLMTGVGVVMISSCAAFGCALTNPFSTAIAHSIAELPIYSAMGYRFLCFCVTFLAGWLYLMLYVRKIKKDLPKSMSADIQTRYTAIDTESFRFTPKLARAGIVFLAIFGYMIYGTVAKGFQFGDGFSNFIFFTNGSLIAMLAVADVPYTRWGKFFGKLFAIIMVLSIIFVAIAASIGLGPF